MSLISSIKNTFENMFVPHDGLYSQAKDAVGQADADGDGKVNVLALGSGTQSPPNGNFGITDQGYIAADNFGDGDGFASVKEIRNYLKSYDETGDKRVEGAELLTLLDDLAATMPKSAAAQAGAGAGQLA
ncbi:MAG: hypothetical protein JWM98_2267 [Thermoleophilia bacterium]|nr:hypothetical protein [Thermoleophilia bacterium]